MCRVCVLWFQNLYDLTIVDMGDLPEVSVSVDNLSLLRAPSYGMVSAGPGYDACRDQKAVPECPTEDVFLLRQID